MPIALAVRREDLLVDGLTDGVTSFVLTDPDHVFSVASELLNRDVCETDDDYVQLVPFITLFDIKTGAIYLHNRFSDFTRRGDNNRYSLGISGHIETQPFGSEEDYSEDLKAIIATTAVTILNDKVGLNAGASLAATIKGKLNEGKWGCIYFDSNYHDRHHLAISVFLGINKDTLVATYDHPASHGVWLSAEDIEKALDDQSIEIDCWSRIVLGLTAQV